MARPELSRRYTLLDQIGSGSLTRVYRARDLEEGRDVAIKVVGADAAPVLRAEAEVAAKLRHPNILALLDFGEGGGEAWLVMELVEGCRTLRERFGNDERLSLAETLHVMGALLAALAHARGAGVIVHGELRPARILMDHGGGVKVAGLAQPVLNPEGTRSFAKAYRAPEQFRGEQPDMRTDIWAAGVILYRLITGGEMPFTGGMSSLTRQVQERDPEPPSAFGPTVPPTFDAVVLRALAKDPDRRFPNAAAFSEAIHAAASSARVLHLDARR